MKPFCLFPRSGFQSHDYGVSSEVIQVEVGVRQVECKPRVSQIPLFSFMIEFARARTTTWESGAARFNCSVNRRRRGSTWTS